MESTLPSSPRILLVEPDPALQSLLGELLGLEGYAVSVAASVEEVSARLAGETFALVLADVYVGRAAAGSDTPAHQLRRLVSPTPLGLLMTLPFSAADAQRAGFAFVVPMPFELDDLLVHVASVLQQPQGREHAQQVQRVERFFTARAHEDWPTLLALCTEDVVFYPSSPSGIHVAGRLQGQVALQHALAAIGQAARGQIFLHRYYAALPKGLIVRYVRLWTTPEEERRREAKIGLFHFRGGRICQVGLRPGLLSLQRQAQSG